MSGIKFYICRHCGNIIAYCRNSGVPVVCCGEEMTEIIPNTVDASSEKHIPVISANGSTVTVDVGSLHHPMEDVHYIEWIALRTNTGNQRKELKPGDAPKATFALTEGDFPAEVYAYCNKHGLWKAQL